MQVMARGQEELRQTNLRVAAANPSITLPVNSVMGTSTPIVTQPPPEGGPVNQNDGPTFNIPIGIPQF